MSEDSSADQTPQVPNLKLIECRVLGVLVEKAKTTPDAYPLSINALTNGCNQKSNRDPVLNLDEAEVEDTLLELQKVSLVTRITGSGRVERWRHNLYDEWQVGKVDLAILAELLLRGAQTVGELRGRANRMENIPNLEFLREHLDKLENRKMVVWLSPPGQRGAKLTHGFQAAEDLERIRARQAAEAVAAPRDAAAATPVRSNPSNERIENLENALTQANNDIAALRTTVAELQSIVANMNEDLKSLKDQLGA